MVSLVPFRFCYHRLRVLVIITIRIQNSIFNSHSLFLGQIRIDMAGNNVQIKLLCTFKEYRKPIILGQFGDLYEEIRLKFEKCHGFDFNSMHLKYNDNEYGLIDLDDLSALDDRSNNEIIITCRENEPQNTISSLPLLSSTTKDIEEVIEEEVR